MTTFYFNELLPSSTTRDVRTLFDQTIERAVALMNKLNFSKPIFTGETSSKLRICGFTLIELINQCDKRNVRTAAQYLFTHNLIAEHEKTLNDRENQELLEADYCFLGEDAINLAIANKMGWPILSIPLNEALEHDSLKLTSRTTKGIEVVNYYAQEDTSFIERWVFEKESACLEGLEQFKAMFGIDRIIISPEFEKNWNDATGLLQQVAFEKFKVAIASGMVFPVKIDGDLIKKTTNNGEVDVYELRQLGQGLRIYFGYSLDGNRVIMAGLYTKAQSVNKEQTADINRSGRIIKKYIYTPTA